MFTIFNLIFAIEQESDVDKKDVVHTSQDKTAENQTKEKVLQKSTNSCGEI